MRMKEFSVDSSIQTVQRESRMCVTGTWSEWSGLEWSEVCGVGRGDDAR